MIATAVRMLFTRATPENPAFDLNSPDAWDAFGAVKSATGLSIGYTDAMRCAPFWRGVNLLAGYVGKLPLMLYHRIDDGKERAAEHPAYQLVLREPNRYMEAFTFWQTIAAHVISKGNGYAFIDRNGAGEPIELLPLNPDSTVPYRRNGVLAYLVSAAGEQRTVVASDVLHVRGLGYDGLIGYDVISYWKETLGVSIAARDYGARFFANDATPGVALKFPAKLSEAAATALKDNKGAFMPGLENRHKLAILEEGGDIVQISRTAKDSQLIELSEHGIRQIANILGIQPHKLGDFQAIHYASRTEANQEFLDDGLDPRLVPIEQECDRKLLTEAERRADSHFFEFNRKALMVMDAKAEAEIQETEMRNGVTTVNEWRAMTNRNSIGPIGDVRLAPLNMTTLDKLVADAEKDDEPEEPVMPEIVIGDGDAPEEMPDDAEEEGERSLAVHRAVVISALARAGRRLCEIARRRCKQPEFMDWIDRLEADHGGAVRGAIIEAIASLRQLRSNEGVELIEPLAVAFLADVRERFLRACEVQPAALVESVSSVTIDGAATAAKLKVRRG